MTNKYFCGCAVLERTSGGSDIFYTTRYKIEWSAPRTLKSNGVNPLRKGKRWTVGSLFSVCQSVILDFQFEPSLIKYLFAIPKKGLSFETNEEPLIMFYNDHKILQVN